MVGMTLEQARIWEVKYGVVPNGTVVMLIGQTFTWGMFTKEMIGTVVESQPLDGSTQYWVDVPSVGRYHCLRKDFELKDERVLASSSLTKFYETRKTALVKSLEGENNRLREASKRIKSIKRATDCLAVPDTDVFNMIKKQIDSVRFEGTVMTIKTLDVVIPYTTQDGLTLHVPMGRFSVQCDFGMRSTYFRAIDEGHICIDGRIHPHISGTSACWGSYAPMVIKCYKTLDVCSLISTVLDYLNSCDRFGWYTSVLRFAHQISSLRPLVTHLCFRCEHERDHCECENHCSECDNHQDDCTCNLCEYCEYPDDQCECRRCPDSNERLQGGVFPDQQCSRCSLLTKDIDKCEWRCAFDGEASAYYDCGLGRFTPIEDGHSEYTTYANGKYIPHVNLKR